jgi:hypothetical protein
MTDIDRSDEYREWLAEQSERQLFHEIAGAGWGTA